MRLLGHSARTSFRIFTLLAAISALLLTMAVPFAGTAEAATEHCPDHQTSAKVEVPDGSSGTTETIVVDGREVKVVVDGATVSFSDPATGDPVDAMFCLKGSTGAGGRQGPASSASVSWVNDGGQTPAISYVVVYSVPPPTVTVAFEKVWAGDDPGDDAVATLELSNAAGEVVERVTEGNELDITDYQGQALTVGEEVADLPDNCTVTGTDWTLNGAPFDGTETVPEVNSDTLYTLVATNTVDCTAPTVGVGGDDVDGSATVVKEWAGDDVDLTDVTVVLETNRGNVVPGQVIALDRNDTLTVMDETVAGLPDNCTYTSDLPEDGASFTATEVRPNGIVTIVNTVACQEPAQPSEAGSGTILKEWDTEGVDTSGVTVIFNTNQGNLSPGQTVTLDVNESLTVTGETVAGLPDNCTYTSSELPATFTSTAEDPHGVITVTNDVSCTDVGGEVITSVLLEKAWDISGPAWLVNSIDVSELDVAFTLDGAGTVTPGDRLSAEPGDVLTILSEDVDGLSGACEVTDTLDTTYEVTDDDDQIWTVTNVVDCAAVQGAVHQRPSAQSPLPQAAPTQLAATGFDLAKATVLATLLTALGAVLLAASQRRRHSV